jgi:diphthine-ammonia ligase
LYIAGQIALQPASLTLPTPPSFETEVVLALQHVRRIVKAVQEGPNGNFAGYPESCICWLAGSESELEDKKKIAYHVWNLFNGQKGVAFEFRYASELPRGALVEWQIVWSTGRTPEVDSDDEES